MNDKRMRVFILLLLLTVILFVPAKLQAKKISIKKISVVCPTGTSAYVGAGENIKLKTTVQVTPNKRRNKSVFYKSSKTGIATVSQAGKVRGKRAGITKVTVYSKINHKKKAKITVHVVKPLKKIKMQSNVKSIYIGEPTKLSVVYTPKTKIYKKLSWSSSNKKIVTVKDGVLTGQKEGIAKITAKTKDGTKRTASCTVAVYKKTEPVVDLSQGVESVDVVSSGAIRVKLKHAAQLEESVCNIFSKQYYDGKYLSSHKIEKIRKRTESVFDLYTNQPIEMNRYVKVVISDGTNEIQGETIARYKIRQENLSERIVKGVTGESLMAVIDFGDNLVGYRNYSIGTLPDGINGKVDGNQVVLSGTPQKVANDFVVSVIGTDEVAHTVTQKVHFVIGSKTRTSCYAKELTVIADEKFELELPVVIAGKTTTVSVGTKPSGVSFKNGVLSGTLSEGEYMYQILIGTSSMLAKIHVVKGCEVTGKAEPGITICAKSYEKNGSTDKVVVKKDGTFELLLLPGYYDFYAGTESYLKCQIVTSTILDFQVENGGTGNEKVSV